MNVIYDSRFKSNVTLIGIGEYHVSSDLEIISTTLGSCITICLYVPELKIGGMNHYMLPEPVLDNEDNIVFSKAKYGINSMEMLINKLLRMGAKKENLKAKVFGGANLFGSGGPTSIVSVGDQNIAFARKYLTMEKIPIVSEDVGKDHARKIYFDTGTGKVKLFRLNNKIGNLVKDEKVFKEKIVANNLDKKIDSKKITFF